MSKTVYISPSVLAWRPFLPGGAVLSDMKKRRAYDLLRRAESFLKIPSPQDHDRADCLGNLRRALTHRVQVLEQIYRLRVPLCAGSKQHFLELLAEVAVIRPTMLRALLAARNAVEYSDKPAPSLMRCAELVDAVWYFLRTTDPYILTRRDDFQLTSCEKGYPGNIYYLQVGFRFGARFRVSVSGWIPGDLVRNDALPDWLQIEANDIGNKAKWGGTDLHRDKRDTDVWIRGVARCDRNQIAALLSLAFEAE